MSNLVFGPYDQEALDRQLNLRARWPEHEAFFARWATQSEAARGALPCKVDLAYGADPAERLDLFPLADRRRAAPCLAFVHGGYWQSLDKSDFGYLAPAFVDAGIALASLNYGLAPDYSVGTMVGQIREALLWLWREGNRFGIDTKRIFVAGHSAGGHLAVMAALADWPTLDDSAPSDLLRGAVSVSGVYELEPIRLSYHNEILALDPAEVPRISPRNLIPDCAPSLYCAVGAEETDEFLRQQRAFAADWKAAGLTVSAEELPGLNHFSIIDALGDHTHSLYGRVSRMILERA